MAKPLAKFVAVLTPKRRWAQFSLATMFVVVTVLCMWLAAVVNRAHRQRDVVAAIVALGGRVEYAEPDTANEALPRRFLRRWLPRDYLNEVKYVYLNDTQVTDSGLAELQGLTALQSLHLGDTQITDAGLCHLEGLTSLQALDLRDTQVTDAGLAHLQGMTGLKVLWLKGSKFSDAGLPCLQGLAALKWLWIYNTQVTETGAAQFRKALPNCKIAGQ